MKEEHEVIDEATLDDLEPSVEFADLMGRVGNQAGIGNLSLGAIRMIVRERAAGVDEAETEPASGLPAEPTT